MPYLNETGLAYYNEKLQPWISSQPVKTIPSTLYPWTLTEKAGAVTCWPVGGTPLLPTVDFMFTEVPPASGDKGPENPSTISGVSSVKVTRCGKNLLRYNYNSNTVQPGYSVTTSGVTVSNDHGVYSISGSNTSGGVVDFNIVTRGSQELVLPSGDYVFSANFPSGFLADARIQIVGYQNEDIVVNTYSKDTSRTFTVPNGEPVVFILYIRIGTGAVIPSGCVASPQIELDSTATSFEPYDGADYPLPLGSTYYGGTIDLASGVMTVDHVVCELDGTEWWSSASNDAPSAYNPTTGYGWSYCIPKNKTGFEAILSKNSNQDPSIVSCTHFQTSPTGIGDTTINNGTVNYPAIFLNGSQCRFSFQYSSVSIWKNYLATQKTAGTPVQVAYLINEPYTVQLSPTEILSLTQTDKYTPRLNTVYTDASAVQVGYVKSPIREEYELTQAIVAQGGEI